jgi:threonine aldolase
MKGFASDNYAGVHPDVMAAIAAANVDHAVSYGDDPWTARFEAAIRREFGEQARAFPVFNGTAANVLSLQALMRPYEAVICASTAHINVDECGAPERYLGSKLLDTPTPDGKLTPALVEEQARGFGDQHHVQPRVVSIAQSTELGTVYAPDEIRAIAGAAHGLGLLLHVDGARVANAAAALGTSLRALTTDLDVDVLSLGGTKIGAMGAEAVVFLKPQLAERFPFWRKQAMQLASKMRFVSAQLEALLTDELWPRNASHANAMAARLAAGVADIDGVELTRPVQANGVFAILPPPATAALQPEWPFYVWDGTTGEVRWMCSWDTTPEEVDGFVEAVRHAVAAARVPNA